MRITIILFFLVVLLLAVGSHAQNVSLTPSVLSMAATAVAANCPAPIAGQTVYCFAADKLQVSPNGGAYVTIWPAAGGPVGVSSFNGRSGAVMPVASDYPFPPAPVTSVNGKTGAVVITASTQLQ